MSYEAREGVDYIVDLYQVVGVEPLAEADIIKSTIRARMMEYHPDRLQGLAPEFKTTGERMATLLNRANAILLDPTKRAQYDEILEAWEGPVSKDGIPVINMNTFLRADMTGKTPEEIEAHFEGQREKIKSMVGFSPSRLELLERMLETAPPDMQDDLRRELDATLLAQDRVLSIEEAERGRLVGHEIHERYETQIGYAESVVVAIEQAKEEIKAEHTFRALGGVGMRLALLAGESTTAAETEESATLVPAGALPAYFEDQAKKIAEIVEQREDILQKRLENFEPNYFVPEVQLEPKGQFAVLVKGGGNSTFAHWFGFTYDGGSRVESIVIPEDVQAMLDAEEYEQAYEAGFNTFSFVHLDHIDLPTLLNEAVTKYITKFYAER